YTEQKKYAIAEEHLKKGFGIIKSIGSANLEKDIEKHLSILYEATGKTAEALRHYKNYIVIRDTIYSAENNKKLLRSEIDNEYEKKKAITDAEHKVEIKQQKIIAAEKTRRQNIIIGSVIAGLIL